MPIRGPDPQLGQSGPLAHKIFVVLIKRHSGYGRPTQADVSFSKVSSCASFCHHLPARRGILLRPIFSAPAAGKRRVRFSRRPLANRGVTQGRIRRSWWPSALRSPSGFGASGWCHGVGRQEPSPSHSRALGRAPCFGLPTNAGVRSKDPVGSGRRCSRVLAWASAHGSMVVALKTKPRVSWV